jgi:hypothetical protein
MLSARHPLRTWTGAAALLVGTLAGTHAAPLRAQDAAVERRVDSLLARLSLDE